MTESWAIDNGAGTAVARGNKPDAMCVGLMFERGSGAFAASSLPAHQRDAGGE